MSRWIALLKLLPHAGGGLIAGAVMLNVAFGLLPSAFIVLMSYTLAGYRAALASAIVAIAAQQMLAPFLTALGEVVSRRVDGHCAQRILRASFQDAPVPVLEQREVLDKLGDVRSAFAGTLPTPGNAAAACLALIARYTALSGAIVLVAIVLGLPIAAMTAVVALIIRYGQRGSLGLFGAMWDGLSGLRRQVAYLRDLATGPVAGKEIRALGLRDWITRRLGAEHRSYQDTLWAGRRKLLLWPFTGYAGIGLAGAGLSLYLMSGRQLTVLEYAIAIQAVLVPIRFGVYFPEADVQTQFGGRVYVALQTFESHAQTPSLAGTKHASVVREAIRFDNVHFGYSDAPVLRGLNLTIPAGKSTAIVGLNGAGKTTLVKLLARFYDPDAGVVTVDQQDLRSISPSSWHDQLAVIFQDFVRYELTVAENIGLGAPSGHRQAADRAGALSIVEDLSDGFDTPLFSRYAGGRDLSGGQWQRIALARAFHAVGQGASVLVLDEPTAQLDVRSEVDFFDNFLAHTEGLTSIIISHRFSTVRRADHIAVLADGVVAEYGTHESLLADGGRYAEMFHLQAQRFATV